MLETRAKVVQVNGREAWVEVDSSAGCNMCKSEGGCGSSKLGQLFCSASRRFRADNSIDAHVGDEVLVVVADGTILRGVGLMYLIPLVLLLAGALLGTVWAGSSSAEQDGYAVTGAVLGLAAGLISSRWLSAHAEKGRFQAYLTRRATSA
jgi:sigma-E factor negative regulatory protein RseC